MIFKLKSLFSQLNLPSHGKQASPFSSSPPRPPARRAVAGTASADRGGVPGAEGIPKIPTIAGSRPGNPKAFFVGPGSSPSRREGHSDTLKDKLCKEHFLGGGFGILCE